MDEELKGYLDALRQDLTGQIAESSRRSEMLNAETRVHAERLNVETRAHAEDLHSQGRILIENIHRDVRVVAEGVQAINEKLDRIRRP